MLSMNTREIEKKNIVHTIDWTQQEQRKQRCWDHLENKIHRRINDLYIYMIWWQKESIGCMNNRTS